MNPKSAKLNLQHENNNIALLPAYSKVLHSSAEFWSVHCESDGVLTNIFNAEQAKYATKNGKIYCILLHTYALAEFWSVNAKYVEYANNH